MSDDRILVNLVLNENTVVAVENRVRNLVNRLNHQNIRLNINGRNLDNVINRLNAIQRQIQRINATPVNINANLTQAQQQYRLETERLRVTQRLELSRQRTLQTENQAISALAQQNRTLNVNNNVTHQIEQGVQNIGNNMNVAGAHARDFVDYLADGVRYILVYRSLYEIMNQVGEAFSEMKNVDKELINVRKTTGMSEGEIENIRKDSYGVATDYGRTASEYLGSVSEFARGGYKELSTELAKVSLLTQNVGDVSAESADKMLLSVDAAYKLNGNVAELTNVVNGLNNIANLNPTSMQKMADGIQVSASMAKVAGLEISDLVALIGTGTAVTQREGGEIARAIRTILMNIRAQKGELEDGTIIDDESIAKAEAVLNGVGVATKEVVNGVRELRDPMDILDELASKWSTLNTEAKSVVLESLANKRQANVLAAILENYEMVAKMQSEYFNSANSAIKENELFLQGWEATSNRVSAKWTEYIANMADTSLITGSLNALYGVLVSLDTPIGRIATQIVLINTALAVTGRLWGAIRARSVVADILSLGVAERNLGTAIQLVSGHLGRQALLWASSPFGMATIAVAGVMLVNSAIEKYKENLRETAEESANQAEESANYVRSILELKSQLEEGTKSTDELTSAFEEQLKQMGYTETGIDNLIKKYGGLEEAIKGTTEEVLVKSQADARGAKDDSKKYALTELGDFTNGLTYEGGHIRFAYDVDNWIPSDIGQYSKEIQDEFNKFYVLGENADKTQNIDDLLDYYNQAQKVLGLLKSAAVDDEDIYNESAYIQAKKAVDNLSTAMDGYADAITRVHEADAQVELADYRKTNDIDSKDSFNEYIDGIKANKEYSEEYKQVLLSVANKVFPQFSSTVKTTGEDIDTTTDSLKSLTEALKEVENAYELVNKAQKEINSDNKISSETIQEILNKYPDLEDEMYEYIMNTRTGVSVLDLLKTKAGEVATMSEKAFKKMYLSSNMISDDMKEDFESAFKIIGLEWDNTQSLMANVNTQIVDANGQATTSFVEQWTEACRLAGANVSNFAQGISSLLTGEFYDGTSGVYRVKDKGIYYKDGSGMDGKGTNLVNVKAMELLESGQYTDSGDAYKAAYNILSTQMDKAWENKAEFERRQKEFEERMRNFSTQDTDGSGSGSSKDPKAYDDHREYFDYYDEELSTKEKFIDNFIDENDRLNRKFEKALEEDDFATGELLRDKLNSNIKNTLEALAKNANDARYVLNEDIMPQIADIASQFGFNFDGKSIAEISDTEIEKVRQALQNEINRQKDIGVDMENAETGDNAFAIKTAEIALQRFEDLNKSAESYYDKVGTQSGEGEWGAEYLELEAKILENNLKYQEARSEYLQDQSDDIEHQIDLQRNAFNGDDVSNEFIKNEIALRKQQQEIAHQDAEMWREYYRALGYTEDAIEKTAEVQEAQKTWWEHQQQIFDSYQETIDKATKGMDERIKTLEYEYEQENLVIDALEKRNELQRQLREEQRELRAEYEATKDIIAITGDDGTLFNKEDYDTLAKEIKSIDREINSLYEDYRDSINALSEDEWYKQEEITNEFERQQEALLDQYEIAKQQLEVTRQRTKLENVLNEKNKRVLIGGKWVNTPDLQAVYEERKNLIALEDEEYELRKESAENKHISALRKLNDSTNTETKAIQHRIDMINEMTAEERKALAEELLKVEDMDDILNGLNEGALPKLVDVIESVIDNLGKLGDVEVDRPSSGGSSDYETNIENFTKNEHGEYVSTRDENEGYKEPGAFAENVATKTVSLMSADDVGTGSASMELLSSGNAVSLMAEDEAPIVENNTDTLINAKDLVKLFSDDVPIIERKDEVLLKKIEPTEFMQKLMNAGGLTMNPALLQPNITLPKMPEIVRNTSTDNRQVINIQNIDIKEPVQDMAGFMDSVLREANLYHLRTKNIR